MKNLLIIIIVVLFPSYGYSKGVDCILLKTFVNKSSTYSVLILKNCTIKSKFSVVYAIDTKLKIVDKSPKRKSDRYLDKLLGANKNYKLKFIYLARFIVKNRYVFYWYIVKLIPRKKEKR